MAFREDTKATPAEIESFKLVPETCPDIEAAFDKLSLGPSAELIQQVLASYGIETNKALRLAIIEIYGKHTSMARAELRDVVMFKGTFPLRLALVQKIERGMAPGQPESRYARWLRSHNPAPAREE